MSSKRWTRRQALTTFFSYTSPRILLALCLLLVPARLLAGGWTVHDAIIPVLMVAVHPFTEWIIHVYLLHWRPRKIGGRTIDFVASRDHRAHHRDPSHLPLVFIPLPTMAAFSIIGPALWWVVAPNPQAWLTGVAWAACMALFYEWTHFVCHVPYTSPSAWMRQRVKHHTWHHYKNEAYWYGVTLHLGDRVLRTQPDPATVERSPTARDLDARTA